MTEDVKIPDIGENVESGEVVKILVSKGDTVEVDQPLIELETDKAVVEIPSPVAGKVSEILVQSGDTLEIGQVVAKIEKEDEDSEAKEVEPKAKSTGGEEKKEKPPKEEEEGKEEKRKAAAEQKEPERGKREEEDKEKEEHAEEEDEEQEEPARPEGGRRRARKPEPKPGREEEGPSRAAKEEAETGAPAAPSVRRLARELGTSVDDVKGTGPGGRITPEDVKAHVRRLLRERTAPARDKASATDLPDFSRWGPVRRESLNKVRAAIAQNTGAAWSMVPHVTQFDEADITQLEEFRRSHAEKVEKAGGKLTLTTILTKLVVQALKQFPRFNASLDLENNEIIYKDYYHVGIAVDTDRGLLVPVVRDVDKKSINDLAVELPEIAQRAREGKVSLDELRGGSFTISNQGGIGGTDFTPVVFWPQAAILGVSRARYRPLMRESQFEPRLVLPLALSYDHRIVDGADAARFLSWLARALENPVLGFFVA
ncbi:MAG: biotin/lipoyl-binding protein [Candidatus Eisenbacteria bacterium]|nr:biotin/lipoyl-binding protein [Candidatus Eisenbacteria bacterium]